MVIVTSVTNLRYTKALDNIKALRKERTAELKVDKERLKFFKADKDKAEKVRRRVLIHSDGDSCARIWPR